MFTTNKIFSRDLNRTTHTNFNTIDSEKAFFASKAKFGNTTAFTEMKATYDYVAADLNELNAWRESLINPTDDEKQSA